MFAKTELFAKQNVLAAIKFLRNLLLGLEMRCEERIGGGHLFLTT